MYTVSLFDRISGVPVFAEQATNETLDEVYYKFQQMAMRDGYGVIVTEGGGYQLGNYDRTSEPRE
jgi:hypothetical protein